MFDKLKQLQQARELQKSLEREVVEEEVRGVKVRVNGAFRVEEVSLNADLPLREQERAVQECLNAALGRMQGIMAQKMRGMLGGV